MPLYLFQNPKTQEIKEVILGMNDDKAYVDKDQLEWKRLFLPIQVPSSFSKKLNEKDLCQGGKYKIHHITEEVARAQGCKNANEYIEVNNALVEEHKKKLPSSKKKFIK